MEYEITGDQQEAFVEWLADNMGQNELITYYINNVNSFYADNYERLLQDFSEYKDEMIAQGILEGGE